MISQKKTVLVAFNVNTIILYSSIYMQLYKESLQKVQISNSHGFFVVALNVCCTSLGNILQQSVPLIKVTSL